MIWRKTNFVIALQWLIPTNLRRSQMVDFLKCNFLTLQKTSDAVLYKTQHNSQVLYLEKVLNEWFEVDGYDTAHHLATRTIFISDAPQLQRRYIYRPSEEQPMYLGLVYLNRGSSMITNGFVVNIPAAYIYDTIKLKAVIDFYKLAGKTYTIQTY